MNKEIFGKAKQLSRYIEIVNETNNSIDAKIGEIEMRIWKENNQLKSWCTCKHFSVTTSECSHLLALKYFLMNQETLNIPIIP